MLRPLALLEKETVGQSAARCRQAVLVAVRSSGRVADTFERAVGNFVSGRWPLAAGAEVFWMF